MDALDYPRLRPVEAIPDPRADRVLLRDPTQLASGVLVVGQEQLLLLSLMDGTRARRQIQAELARRGQLLLSHELDQLLAELGRAGFLAGTPFDEYYARLERGYREAPFRKLRDREGFGTPSARLPAYLDAALEEAGGRAAPPSSGRLVGLVVPHLDYPRGLPCYAPGYAALRAADRPRRVVVLGTNHFGRSRSVVATTRDFETHWGVVPTDRDFLARLQAETGGNLMPYELDHLHEHSIELHAVWLRHVLGPRVRMVPVLCPDPSGPRGTRAGDPDGVDLREFARALGALLRRDPVPTLVIASADLSHVGGYFGDDCPVDDRLMAEVRAADEAALRLVDRNDPEAFREHMAGTGNPTRVCSVGCLYALMVALGPEARPRRLRYHQAVTAEIQNAVTCAAYTFSAP